MDKSKPALNIKVVSNQVIPFMGLRSDQTDKEIKNRLLTWASVPNIDNEIKDGLLS